MCTFYFPPELLCLSPLSSRYPSFLLSHLFSPSCIFMFSRWHYLHLLFSPLTFHFPPWLLCLLFTPIVLHFPSSHCNLPPHAFYFPPVLPVQFIFSRDPFFSRLTFYFLTHAFYSSSRLTFYFPPLEFMLPLCALCTLYFPP